LTDEEKKMIRLPSGGVVNEIWLQVRLIARLMADRRVNPLIKLLPIGSLVYLISPIDFPTPIDDAAILWLASFLFVELCPPEVVEEHKQALRMVVPGEARDAAPEEGEVIEGEFWEDKPEP